MTDGLVAPPDKTESLTSPPPFVVEPVDRLLAEHRVGGESWYVVRENLFAIPRGRGHVLYSPLQGIAVLISNDGLASLLLNPDMPVSDALAFSLLEGSEADLKGFDLRPLAVPEIDTPAAADFRPVRLMLSPTAACQLACDYCYIRGGDNPRNMPWEIVEAAVRLVAKNAASQGLDTLQVEFHGQGEPTANWRLFRDAVLFIEAQCTVRDLAPEISIQTNGILTRRKIDFLADHGIQVGLSLDGLKQSTDAGRPLRSGKSSFDRILQSIRLMQEQGLDFGVRATITERSVSEMADFVDFLRRETSCRIVDFEPACGIGRAVETGTGAEAHLDDFADAYRDASARGRVAGVDVGCPGSRIDGVRTSFCGAYGSELNFCVSTEGLVSSCYEVLEASDPRAEFFVYGNYDPEARGFRFDQARLEALLGVNVTTIGRCQDCYVKWTCGGGCASHMAISGIDRITSAEPERRCAINRSMTLDEIARPLAATQDNDPA